MSEPDRLHDVTPDSMWLTSLVFDSPFRWDTKNTVIPGVFGFAGARKSRTFTLDVRSDAFFSDGTRVTADAIRESMLRLQDTPHAWRLRSLESAEILSDGRLEITLSRPDASIFAALAHPALALKSAAGLGSGPFVQETPTTYRRNPRFWQFGRPRIDELSVHVYEDDVQRSLAMATGEIDILPNVPLLDVPMLLHEPTVYLVGGPGNKLCYLQLNLNVPELGDPRVRRLLAEAVDRSRLVQIATANQAEAASTLFAPGVWTTDVEDLGRPSSADVRQQLQELGVPSDLRLHLLADNADATLANTAVVLQEQLANCGISLSITLLEGAELESARSSNQFDLVVSYTEPWRDPHELVWPLLSSTGSRNWNGYDRVDVDLLLKAAISVSDVEFRRDRYTRLEGMIRRDVPIIPLFRPYSWDAVSTSLPGYGAFPPATSRGMLTLKPTE